MQLQADLVDLLPDLALLGREGPRVAKLAALGDAAQSISTLAPGIREQP